jgi:bacterial/archaeal transporter family protein
MHFSWLWFAVIVLISWGTSGLFQKLASNQIASESNMVLLAVGYFLTQPFFLPDAPLTSYSTRAVVFGLCSGFFSNLSAWGQFEAMRLGGTASIVTVFTALYPLPVVLLSPIVLHERITTLQGVGILFAMIAVVLLSRAPEPVSQSVPPAVRVSTA